ncbi:DUF3597 domain-containing protein [Caulobacter sp. 73W]|uniref:DUF3597 domain-containing protein n=1 Tax=Caulobacter sp. 73W TaxID=3161137 RepID=A0AB39KWT6_9CAUL
MGLFSSILEKIFNHKSKKSQATPPQQQAVGAPTPVTKAAAPSPAPAAQSAAPQQVDVEAVLSELAQVKGGGGNWRTSIVDLLKLLDLDSSLSARKDLAEELGVRAGQDGSAEQNIALQKAVMKKLADNGGKVPADLRD